MVVKGEIDFEKTIFPETGSTDGVIIDVYPKNVGDSDGIINVYLCFDPNTTKEGCQGYTKTVQAGKTADTPVKAGFKKEPGIYSIGIKVWGNDETRPGWDDTKKAKIWTITILGNICDWIDEVGINNITKTHALYVYYKSQGWNTIAQQKYSQLSPQPGEIDQSLATKDNALGIYYYSQAWLDLGNQKTGCSYM